MKYLATILAIMLTVTVVTLYFIWPQSAPTTAQVAVTVNGHDLARDTITAENGKSGYHSDDYASLLDSAITREVLLQEAQRQSIDKEENFRKALKCFYEQSLIKTLTDRQYNQIEVAVAEAEIDAYLALYGKMVTFARLPVSTTPPYTPDTSGALQNEVLFDDLADSLQLTLAGLRPGEYAIQFDTGSDRYAIQLVGMETAKAPQAGLPDRQMVKDMLLEHKRQQQFVNWLEQLRNNASITIHNG